MFLGKMSLESTISVDLPQPRSLIRSGLGKKVYIYAQGASKFLFDLMYYNLLNREFARQREGGVGKGG